MEDFKDRVKKRMVEFTETDGWSKSIVGAFEYVKISPTGDIILEMDVSPGMSNSFGNMHGGCVSTCFDMATTVALVARDLGESGKLTSSVSRLLDVSFVRPIPIGSRIVIHSEVVSAGRNLALMRGVITDKVTKKTLAVCTHDKAYINLASL